MKRIDRMAIIALKLITENEELVIDDGLLEEEMEKDPRGEFVLDSGTFYYVDESTDAFNDRYKVKDTFATLAKHSYRLAGAMIKESKNCNN